MNKKNIVMYHVFMMLTFVMMVFISSCRDQVSEDLEKDIHVVNKKDSGTSELRSIGAESFYENYVNIEDFKDFQYESDVMWNDHQKRLEKIKNIKVFPSIKSGKYTQDELNEKALYESLEVQRIPEAYENGLLFDYNGLNFINNYDQKTKIEAFVELIFEIDHIDDHIRLLTPNESYQLLNHDDRTKMRFQGCFKENKEYFTKYCSTSFYSELTGIDELDILNLRVITFTRLQIFPNRPGFEKNLDDADLTHYIYQFPFVDNYKDYQNESLTVDDERLLKKYIKPGSVFFVYDKPLKTLQNTISTDIIRSGHSIIVTDLWYDLPDNLDSRYIQTDSISNYGYQSLDQYKKVEEGKDFMSIEELRKDAFDDNISLRDYLKRFVFIEAITDSPNDNSKIPLSNHFIVVKYTSGNDKSALERFDGYTVFAISNLNKGYNITNSLLKTTMLKNVKSKDSSFYNLPIEILKDDNKFIFTDYCSGLVFFGYKNKQKSPGISILTENHLSEIGLLKWYMPRTLTNSPFFYTRISYRKNK